MVNFIPYPLTFAPVFKQYIWGGRNLERLYGRELPEGVIAESWEIAAHEDGATVVDNGILAGQPLTALHTKLGLDLVGQRAKWYLESGRFPLLVKLLDANQKLSVQVHPDDEYARIHEGNELGKDEMWVVLHAEEDAELILGVRAGTTRETLRQALRRGDLDPCLHRVRVRPGDAVCVPSGTVHAILGGSVIAEIQQNSNTTYRVFDWNRKQDGKPRELHIEKALDVIDFEIVEPGPCSPKPIGEIRGVQRYALCENRHFIVERVHMEAGSAHEDECNGDSMAIWGVIDGSIELNGLLLSAVRFTLLPASLGRYQVRANAKSVLLKATLGSKRPEVPL